MKKPLAVEAGKYEQYKDTINSIMDSLKEESLKMEARKNLLNDLIS